jgi:ABC-type branched-subunit amino acid transport system substrate-binding protein
MGIALIAAACGSSGSKSGGSSSGTTAKPTGGTAGAPSGAAPAIAAGAGCKTPVKIGVTYSTDEGAVLTQLGNSALGKEVSSPTLVQTTKALYTHIASYINATGGLAGCPIQFVYYNFQFGDPAGESDNSQNECTAFAEDDHVFAELNQSNENSTLISCLAQKKTVIIYGGGLQSRPTPADYKNYSPYLYSLAYINTYRLGPTIDMLNSAHFFGADPSKAKVGILQANDGTDTNQKLVDTLWKPALAKLGITNPTVFGYNQCHTVSECATTTGQFSSAVLQFRNAGVDKVLFTPDGGDAVFFFFQVAHSQKYYPQYGMTTASGPSLFNTEPKDEQGAAMAVSWYAGDVFPNLPAILQAQTGPNATKTKCAAMLKQYYPAYYQLYYALCDQVFFMQEALKGQTKISADTLKAGADKLGTTFPMASGYGNATFGPTCQYDGATSARVIQWNTKYQVWTVLPNVPVQQFPPSTCP